MMTALAIVLTASALVGQISRNICDAALDLVKDPALMEKYVTASDRGNENSCDIKELIFRVPVSDAEFEALKALQREDGSWADIDYNDPKRGSWSPDIHAIRVQRLAAYYKSSGNLQARDMAFKAMDYWFATMPVCANWWHNEIGIPRFFGPGFILLKDEMGPERIRGAVAVMDKATLTRTGQNKIWLAGNVLLKGLLLDDEDMVKQARDSILSEIRMSDDEEGLQRDWSFHQHGPQLQFGNYGLSFACSLCWWARVLKGTALEIPEENMNVLRGFVEKGLRPLVWNGWYDHNACSRQVFLNAQMGKALCVLDAAANLGIDYRRKVGGTYFPCSDFGVYCGKNWYASVRMQSERIVGYETTNDENLLGYFSADGALLVRRDGDEYDNISPLWDWHHVPGTTSYNDGTSLARRLKADTFVNRTGRVSGYTKGRVMVVNMEIVRDSLSARKAWFFWKGGVVCLGAGISRPGKAPVETTVEQNLLKGKVEQGEGWVRHAGISYVMLDDSRYAVDERMASGKWRWISPAYDDSEVKGEIFEVVISHGPSPVNASYAYVVLPGSGRKAARIAKMARRRVRVIENTPERQTVRIGLKKYTVEWK